MLIALDKTKPRIFLALQALINSPAAVVLASRPVPSGRPFPNVLLIIDVKLVDAATLTLDALLIVTLA